MTIESHDVSRPHWPAELLARWQHVPSAIVADISDGHCLVDPAIRPLKPAGQQPRLFGFALTVKTEPPDFGAVLAALDLVMPQDVVVIDAGGHSGHAMIGGILGGHLHRKAAAGIVCNGAIRDVAELAAMKGFSVYARHITPRGPVGLSKGCVNAAITFGQLQISPGDLLIGDDDGLVCLSPKAAADLVTKAEAKLAREAIWQHRLSQDESLKTVFGV